MVGHLVVLAANAAGQCRRQEAPMRHLRRLPVEPDERARRRFKGTAKETYVWENLSALTASSAGPRHRFRSRKITKALREYAIAGTLHLDHLAQLREFARQMPGLLSLFSFQLGRSLGIKEDGGAR